MHFGIRKFINKILIQKNCFFFWIRKEMFGFENANTMLRVINKNAVISILLRNGATIGSNCDIETPLLFHNCSDYSRLVIGDNCHIGKNCFFDLKDKVILGNNVVVSMCSRFITHIDMSRSSLSKLYPSSSAPITVGNNSYIAVNATILKGVELSEGSFIAASSVVTKNVPPFTMVGGVPAKFIKILEYERDK